MALKLITAPATEPVTLTEAKAHCRVDDTDSDTLLTALIVAAREAAEHATGRALMTQTWELALDTFPASEIELLKTPVQSIATVKYLDSNGDEQTILSSNYALDSYGIRNWVIPAYDYDWPATLDSANAVKVRFVAGYADAASVPQGIKQWMLLQVGHWFANREAVNIGNITGKLPYADALLDPYRVYSL